MTPLVTVLKYVHILSVIVAVGANVSYVSWMRWAGRDRQRLVFAIGGVRRLDRLIANPAYVLVLLTGLGMVVAGYYSFDQGWIRAALGLYVLVALLGIFLYAPVIRRQLAEAERDPSSREYAAIAVRSNVLGAVTTAVVMVIVFLMVAKPAIG